MLLLEKNQKPGIKILISGGGHCNVTTSLGARDAARHFGPEGARFLRDAIRTTPPSTIREWLHERGVATFESEFEKVWPVSRNSRDVVKALVDRAVDAGAELRLGTGVTGISSRGDGTWSVSTDRGGWIANALVLATGGLSYPKTGTTGDGYRWLRALGVRLVAPKPALAPLRVDDDWVRELSGLTLDDVEVQLREASGRIAWRRRRPLLFTHKGVSGPGPMDASGRIEREPGRYRFHVDLCPDRSEDELRAALFSGKTSLVNRLSRDFGVPKRLAQSLVARFVGDRKASEVSKIQRRQLVQELKGMTLDVRGSLGFSQAEVSTGGIELDQVDPKTMELRAFPGLFVTGELLDVDGPIGGFSFLAAFATGVLAGRAAGRADVD